MNLSDDTEATGEAVITMADVLATNDLLFDQFDAYRRQFERELPAARESGDHRYILRIELAIEQIASIEDALDGVLEQVGALRHLEGQLTWARDGKMV